jgi:hypothetical protein
MVRKKNTQSVHRRCSRILFLPADRRSVCDFSDTILGLALISWSTPNPPRRAAAGGATRPIEGGAAG